MGIFYAQLLMSSAQNNHVSCGTSTKNLIQLIYGTPIEFKLAAIFLRLAYSSAHSVLRLNSNKKLNIFCVSKKSRSLKSKVLKLQNSVNNKKCLESYWSMNLGGCVIPIWFMTSNWSYFEFSHQIHIDGNCLSQQCKQRWKK